MRIGSCSVFAAATLVLASICMASFELTLTTATLDGADSSVREEEANANFGAGGELSARFNSSGQLRNRFTLLRFDLSSIPSGSQLTSASLQLYDMRSGGHGSTSGVTFHLWALEDDTLDGWSEQGVTWTNAPGRVADATPFNGPDFGAKVRFLKSFTFAPAGSPVSGQPGWGAEIPLLPELASTFTADGNQRLTLFITQPNASETDYVFGSKENLKASRGAADTLPAGTTAPRLRLVGTTSSGGGSGGGGSSGGGSGGSGGSGGEGGASPTYGWPTPATGTSVTNFNDVGWSTRGGYGGQVIKVTNLNKTGPGSLHAALNAAGPRIIVFEVGGVIDWGGVRGDQALNIVEPYVTIAGQTAPDPGITIIRGELAIRTHDVVIQHITIRPGDAGHSRGQVPMWDPDGMQVLGPNAYNVLIDHCTVTWAVDEGISISGDRNVPRNQVGRHVTVSHCLIAEGLFRSSNSYDHSMGSLIHDHTTGHLFLSNLYAHNGDRHPFYKSDVVGLFMNNLIFRPTDVAMRMNWVGSEIIGTPVPGRVGIINNHLLGRPGVGVYLWGDGSNRGAIFHTGNLLKHTDGTDVPFVRPEDVSKYTWLDAPPMWPEGLDPMPAADVYNYTLAHAGARPASRHPIDQRIINHVINRTGARIDSQTQVGGYPTDAPTSRALAVPDGGPDAVQKWLRDYAAALEGPGRRKWIATYFEPWEQWDQRLVNPNEKLGLHTNWVAEAFFADPREHSPLTEITHLQVGGQTFAAVSFIRWTDNRFTYVPERSSTMTTWQNDLIQHESTVLETRPWLRRETWRSPEPIPADAPAKEFFRVCVVP